MHWSHERSDYQVADVDGRAVMYELQADGTGLRPEAHDLTTEDLGQSLLIGGFQLADTAKTPEGLTPYVGDFRAINGNRQFVGLELAAVVAGKGHRARLVGGGSISVGG